MVSHTIIIYSTPKRGAHLIKDATDDSHGNYIVLPSDAQLITHNKDDSSDNYDI